MRSVRSFVVTSLLGLAGVVATAAACSSTETAASTTPVAPAVVETPPAPEPTPAPTVAQPAVAEPKPTKAPEPATPPAPATTAGDKIQLALTPEAGQRFAVESKSHVVQAMMGMETQVDVNQFVVTKVEGLAADGAFSLRTKVARIWGKLSNPMMGEMEFDSDKPEEKSDGDAEDQMAMIKKQMTKQLAAAAGKEVVLSMSRDGSSTTADEGEGEGGQLSRMVGGLGKLPEKPVGVGDTWTTDVEAAVQSLNMKMKTKNTVKALDALSVTIEQEGTMEMAGAGAADSAGPQAKMLASMKTKNSSVKGTLKISRKDGLVLASDTEMSLEMTMGSGDKDEQNPMAGMEMTMKITAHAERKAAPPEEKK